MKYLLVAKLVYGRLEAPVSNKSADALIDTGANICVCSGDFARTHALPLVSGQRVIRMGKGWARSTGSVLLRDLRSPWSSRVLQESHLHEGRHKLRELGTSHIR